jgi:hypothetical protein
MVGLFDEERGSRLQRPPRAFLNDFNESDRPETLIGRGSQNGRKVGCGLSVLSDRRAHLPMISREATTEKSSVTYWSDYPLTTEK